MTRDRAAVVIPAAGMGTRVGLKTPKTFLRVGGVPLLARVMTLFERHRDVGTIQPVLPAESFDAFHRLRQKFRWGKCHPPVAGGRQRQDSVFAGLRALPSGTAVVVVHDAARPFVAPDLVTRVIEAARRHGAAIAALPVPDTVKREGSRLRVRETVDRRSLWLAQTPQAFRTDVIVEAHARAAAEAYSGTDDAELVERLGKDVVLVTGSPLNMKITTREDLVLARRLFGG